MVDKHCFGNHRNQSRRGRDDLGRAKYRDDLGGLPSCSPQEFSFRQYLKLTILPPSRHPSSVVAGSMETFRIQLRPGKNRPRRLRIGVKVPCKFIDGRYKICQILKIKQSGEQEKGAMYYIHYDNYDKRLDRWAHENEFDKTQIGTEKTDDELEGLKPNLPSPDRKVTRAMKRKIDDLSHTNKEHHDPELARLEVKHNEITKVKNIDKIQFGKKWAIDAWYYSPYPEKVVPSGCSLLYICEYCLKYFTRQITFVRHNCNFQQPPGLEIYRHENCSFWEIDGKDQKLFCQNLCLLAKLFLDHKTLYYDVEPFLFYVFTQKDESGYHLVGYFSKEKLSGLGYNLACIMILPPYQKKGWGKYLIHFSYQLSRLEKKVGTPEIPLSDLGRVSYHSYWKFVCLTMLEKRSNLQLTELSRLTGIKESDIVVALQDMNLVKYWKQENVITANPKLVKEHLEGKRPIREIFLEKINWIPKDHGNGKKRRKKHWKRR